MAGEKRYVLALVCVALFGGGLFFGSYASAHSPGEGGDAGLDYDLNLPRKVSPEAAKSIGLKTAEVSRKTVRDVLETSGIVKALPDRTFIAAPRFPGAIRVVTKNVGDTVKAGETIARIASPDVARNEAEGRRLEVEREKLLLESEKTKEEVLQIEQGLRYFKTQVETAQKEYDRIIEQKKNGGAAGDLAARETVLLHDQGLLKIKTREFELSQSMIDLYMKQSESTQTFINALKSMNAGDVNAQDANVMELKAPFDGVVVSRSGSPGQWIPAGQTVVEYADFSVVNVVADLPESLVMRLRERKSNNVSVGISGSQWHGEGILKSVAPALDPRKRTIQVLIEAPNPDGVLLGEMAVNLGLELGAQNQALVVPLGAVLSDGPVRYVFVESGGEYVRQDIVPGAKDDRNIEVKDGLAPGDIVVIEGAAALSLMPGSRRN